MVRGIDYRPFLMAFLFFVAGGLPHAQSESSMISPQPLVIKAATELKAGSNGHFFTTASINNSQIDVLIDTGASFVALSYEDASDAGLHPSGLDYNVPVSTANGVTKAARVSLDKVEIDGVRAHDVPGIVMPEGAMRGSLLGMSFLSRLSSFKVEDGVLILKE